MGEQRSGLSRVDSAFSWKTLQCTGNSRVVTGTNSAVFQMDVRSRVRPVHSVYESPESFIEINRIEIESNCMNLRSSETEKHVCKRLQLRMEDAVIIQKL